MRIGTRSGWFAAWVVVAAWFPASVHAGSGNFTASQDNTLYQTSDGSLSNGAGPHFFAGRNSTPGNIRRAVIAFDPLGGWTPVPPGAIITSATLVLHVSSSSGGASTMSLHRVTSAWGEGASNAGSPGGGGAPSQPGDATWLHTFHDSQFWSTPGGDFVATPSATFVVDQPETYAIGSTPEMVADVQLWVDDPSQNFGWIILGDESQPGTAKRFDSRENANGFFQPQLTIEYVEVPSPAGSLCMVLAILRLNLGRRRCDRCMEA